MSAITGRWLAPSKQVATLAVDWLHGPHRWTSPRYHLATQLRQIRQAFNSHEAREFRSYLLWLGVYPSKGRKV
jgi:hypothetical protein